mgnify:CR=1 FL=1
MYLSGNGKDFTFKHEKIHVISSDDVLISDEIYNRFFELQEQGKQFIVKNKHGQNFEGIFEEVV